MFITINNYALFELKNIIVYNCTVSKLENVR